MENIKNIDSGNSLHVKRPELLENKRALSSIMEVSEDYQELFQGLEETKQSLSEVQSILDEISKKKLSSSDDLDLILKEQDQNEAYTTSAEWLKHNSLKAKGLLFFNYLSSLTFKHCDGIIGLRKKAEKRHQTDAISYNKLIGAKYCRQFVHIPWKNGEMVHAYVSGEMALTYEETMIEALNTIKERISWLHKSSRLLFGNITKDKICFLIDTSKSMELSLTFIKQKLFTLLEDQICHKKKFNFIQFDTHIRPWQNCLQNVSSDCLHSAKMWIERITTGGSTNVLAALKFALMDLETEVIYLLSDGRPDQSLQTVFDYVISHVRIPVHTISFNCNDEEANKFLYQISQKTGGNYHYYCEPGFENDYPPSYEQCSNVDLKLLTKELNKGYEDLNKMKKLRKDYALVVNNSIVNSQHNTDNRVSKEILNSRPVLQPRHRSANINFRNTSLSTEFTQKENIKRPLTAMHTKSSWLRNQISSNKPSKNLPDITQTTLAAAPLTERPNKGGQNNQLSFSPIKEWLKNHGLATKKLTILDALSQTVIVQKPKYVPVLKEHVKSRVFDNLLPLYHVTEENGKSIKVINPNGINLKAYEQHLESAIKVIEKKLDEAVWNALPDKEKEKFKSDVPVSFKNNEAELKNLLKALNWPIKEEDIALLENEINLGHKYLQQSENIREESQKNNRKDLNNSIEKFKEDLEKKNRSNVSKASLLARILDPLRGHSVIARNKMDGYYYSGVVLCCINSNLAEIEFHEIGQQIVPIKFVIPVGGAIPQPLLQIGDFVLMRSFNSKTEKNIYIPGIIQMTSDFRKTTNKFYTVVIYGGYKITVRRKDLVKIGKERFIMTCKYIKEMEETENDSGKGLSICESYSSSIKKFCRSKRPFRHKIDKSSKLKEISQQSIGSDSTRSDLASSNNTIAGKNSSNNSTVEMNPSLCTDYSYSNNSYSQQSLNSENDYMYSEDYEEESESFEDKNCEAENSSHEAESKAKQLQKLISIMEEQKKNQKKQQKKFEKKKKELLKMKILLREEKFKNEQLEEEIQDLKKQNQLIPLEIEEMSKLNVKFEARSDKCLEIPDSFIKARKILPDLQLGERILARWPDDGWYYKGKVRYVCEDKSFFIEDNIGTLERIWREDIISDKEDVDYVIQVNDTVVAPHLNYAFSFAPALVKEISHNYQIKLRFYDGVECKTIRDQVYIISAEKYDFDVNYIIEKEKAWLGKAVIAREDSTGLYCLGTVKKCVGHGHQYLIEWCKGGSQIQNTSHIFGSLTKKQSLFLGDYVLALNYSQEFIFLPGIITNINKEKLIVCFCNGRSRSDIIPDQCFWLSKDYYDMAVAFYNLKTRKEFGNKQ